jgi:hypothetical protein
MQAADRLEATRAQLDANGADYIADGAALLDEVQAFVRRFCAFPDEAALNAVTLWVVLSHMVSNFHVVPRLALLSPEPASGKTRVLEVLDLLVPRSMFCLSASPAAIFRTLSKDPITLLVDECDAIFSKRGKDGDSNEDLRALLNAGYKRGATIPRCVGPKHDVQNFAVFCAAALAGLGNLPDTIMTRSLVIRMRRRGPQEKVEAFRTRIHAPAGNALRDRIARWATLHGPAAGTAWPTLPPGIEDRPAECWEPLIAVADAATGEWPARARAACVSMVRAAENKSQSLRVRLLSDLRLLFAQAGDPEAMHTETIIERLCAGADNGLDDDAPWNEIYGKPITVRMLASMLKEHDVRSTKVKVDGRSLQGYRRASLWDAWARNLPPMSAQAEPAEPAALSAKQASMSVISGSGSGSTSSGTSRKVPDARRKSALAQIADPSGNFRVNGSKVPEVPEVPDLQEPESDEVKF